MGVAGRVATFAGVRYLTLSPDVALNKKKRTNFDHRTNEECNAFRAHRISAATMQPNPITREAEYQAFKARNR
ncbi:unnamed protein product [Aphanomyces euteiches]